MSSISILFFADTHLGFDLPKRPRIKRRRRGDDFFANYELILDAAVKDRVNLLIHGGDLFYRSRIPPELVQRAFLPLKRVADLGIPIFIVPGNHERSRIPYDMIALHDGIHIFNRPRSFEIDIDGRKVVLAGFPYHRKNVRGEFPDLLAATGWERAGGDVNLLCVHHCFEGATVGPNDYVFKYNDDVIRHCDVPQGFAAILTGHVHRYQVLTRDLNGRRVPVPVIYPGSIERTSYAEQDEPKGYINLQLDPRAEAPNQIESFRFVQLPARPMVTESFEGTKLSASSMEKTLAAAIGRSPEDAVLRIRVTGAVEKEAMGVLSAARVRALAPDTMNVDVALVDMRPQGGFFRSYAGKSRGTRKPSGKLDLYADGELKFPHEQDRPVARGDDDPAIDSTSATQNHSKSR